MILHSLGVALVYAGFALGLAGLAALVRPLPRFGLPTRRRGLALGAAGVVAALLGIALPATESRIETPRTALDRIVPVYQFAERHEIRIDAPPERAFDAVLAVTAREITLFRTLTSIRRFGRPGPESILNAPEDRPILEVAARTGFVELALEPGREIVVGTLVIAPRDAPAPEDRRPEWLRSLSESGYAIAVMNFAVEPEGGGSRVVTETRVFATDAWTRRRFAAYWRVIYPGSALIRRMWLRAIERRAQTLDAARARQRPKLESMLAALLAAVARC